MHPGIASGKVDRHMKNRPRVIVWLVTAILMMSIGCKHSDTVGQSCDLTVDAGPAQAVVNLEAAACRTGLCLKPNAPATFDAEAWGWGAQGGLRIAAFIDEFGENGLKHSICERDFTEAMKPFGDTIATKLQNLCIDAKMMDVDPVTPGLQPDCRVVYRVPQADAVTGTVTHIEAPQSLPICPPDATPDTIASDCWRLIIDNQKCPVNGQLINVMRTAAEIADGPLLPGTKIAMQCWTCPDSISRPGCDY
jgi:hypothetical protein